MLCFHVSDLHGRTGRYRALLERITAARPRIFAVLGNDDPRAHEDTVLELEAEGLWAYVHRRRADLEEFEAVGYACIPPSPFRLKDFERYDVA